MSTEYITEYYPNGNKHVQGYYDGTNPDGDFTMWYENGNRCCEGFDVNSDGSLFMSTSWYENGQEEHIGSYEDNEEVGKWRWWHDNGEERETWVY